MTTSTANAIVASTTAAINTNLGNILPVLVVAAVALVVLFKALHWAFGASNSR